MKKQGQKGKWKDAEKQKIGKIRKAENYLKIRS